MTKSSHRTEYQVLNVNFLIYGVGVIIPVVIDEETEHREAFAICPNHTAGK